MRLIFLIITLSLIFAIQVLSADTEIELRTQNYCTSLRGQNISHHSIRKELSGYFKSDEELSDYIVMLYYLMNENKFKNFFILDCKITQVNQLSENEAEVEYKLTGRGLLFFHKDINIKDKWRREKGNWFIIPHEILKKE